MWLLFGKPFITCYEGVICKPPALTNHKLQQFCSWSLHEYRLDFCFRAVCDSRYYLFLLSQQKKSLIMLWAQSTETAKQNSLCITKYPAVNNLNKFFMELQKTDALLAEKKFWLAITLLSSWTSFIFFPWFFDVSIFYILIFIILAKFLCYGHYAEIILKHWKFINSYSIKMLALEICVGYGWFAL